MKIDIQKVFPIATPQEIRPFLSQRSRSVINQKLLLSDTQEYSYRIHKLSGLEKYWSNRWLEKTFPKVEPLKKE